jgi:DNA-binding GntR family transcriptional regulator
LEREKILDSVDRGGFVVRTITSDDARQIYQVRQAIEGHCARLVAEAADPGKAAAALLPLVEATEQWLPAEGLKVAFQRNDALHRGVVEATGNPFLVAAFDLVWARAQSFLMYAALMAIEPVPESPGTGHRDILKAIGAGDGYKAQETMIAHIADGLDAQLEALERQTL